MASKNKSKKKQTQSRFSARPNRSRRRRGRGVYPGSRITKSMFPAAITYSKQNDAQFKNLGSVTHPETGMEGDRYSFRQVLPVTVGQNDSGVNYPLRVDGVSGPIYAQSGFVAPPTLSGGVTSTGWFLSPLFQGSRLAAIAGINTDYVYRKAVVRYIPQTGTNVANTNNHGLAFAVNDDPYIWPEDGGGSAVPTYAEVSQVQPGFQCSAYGSMSDRVDQLVYEYNGRKTWKNQRSFAITGEQAADLRLEHQLRLCAMDNFATSTTVPTNLGTLEFSGIIDFFGPVSGLNASGFTENYRAEHSKFIMYSDVKDFKSKSDLKRVDTLLSELKHLDEKTYASILTKPLTKPTQPLTDEKSSWLKISGVKGQSLLPDRSRTPSIACEDDDSDEVPVKAFYKPKGSGPS